MGWDAMPERSRKVCLELTRRAVATIDEIDALRHSHTAIDDAGPSPEEESERMSVRTRP